MIVGIEGKVVKKEVTFVYIKTPSGLTYKVFVSLTCIGKISTDVIALHVTQIIREDQHSFYGFIDENEKKVFDTLIKLNGIGPSTALAVCSTTGESKCSSVSKGSRYWSQKCQTYFNRTQ